MREFDSEIFQGNWIEKDNVTAESLKEMQKNANFVSHTGKMTHKLRMRLEQAFSSQSGLQQGEDYIYLPMSKTRNEATHAVNLIIKDRNEVEDVVRDVAMALLGVEIDIKYSDEQKLKIAEQSEFVNKFRNYHESAD